LADALWSADNSPVLTQAKGNPGEGG
jgi:hypothetical protein